MRKALLEKRDRCRHVAFGEEDRSKPIGLTMVRIKRCDDVEVRSEQRHIELFRVSRKRAIGLENFSTEVLDSLDPVNLAHQSVQPKAHSLDSLARGQVENFLRLRLAPGLRIYPPLQGNKYCNANDHHQQRRGVFLRSLSHPLRILPCSYRATCPTRSGRAARPPLVD